MSTRAWRKLKMGTFPEEKGWYWARVMVHASLDPDYVVVEVIEQDCVAMDGVVCSLEDASRMHGITHLAGPLVVPPDPISPRAVAEANVPLM